MLSFDEEDETLINIGKQPYFWEEPDPWYQQLKDAAYEDCCFAYFQTRDTILDFSGDQAYYKLAWYLRYNPLYWLAFGVCWTSLLIGKRVHDLVHQGERVRLDETEAEHDARIVWMYPSTAWCRRPWSCVLLLHLWWSSSPSAPAIHGTRSYEGCVVHV